MKIYSKQRSPAGSREGEINVWKYIQQHFLPKVVFDVGIEKASHIVDYRENEDTFVWMFEPSSLHHQDLIKKYGNAKNVFLEKTGLSNEAKQDLDLYTRTGSIFFRNKTIPAYKLSTDSVKVSCITLNDFCREKSIRHIDFIKIDTEGYELNVLQGASEMIDNIDLVQFEFGGTYIDAGISLVEVLGMLPNRHIYAIEKEGLNKLTYEEAYKTIEPVDFLVAKKSLEM